MGRYVAAIKLPNGTITFVQLKSDKLEGEPINNYIYMDPDELRMFSPEFRGNINGNNIGMNMKFNIETVSNLFCMIPIYFLFK